MLQNAIFQILESWTEKFTCYEKNMEEQKIYSSYFTGGGLL